jgi:hypothetical protein
MKRRVKIEPFSGMKMESDLQYDETAARFNPSRSFLNDVIALQQ